MKEEITCVSVVRDYEMYENCIRNNPFCHLLKCIPIDNRENNLAITTHYNEFLDSYTGNGWIIFCHEDWQPLCNLIDVFKKLDKNKIWGPIGAYIEECRYADFFQICGHVTQSDKNGKNIEDVNGEFPQKVVDTLDCQCIMFHSSLIKQYPLRFDQNLDFDLYTEDFCSNAALNFNIESRVTIFNCWHHSIGNIGYRFERALCYMKKKIHECPQKVWINSWRRDS